MTLFRDTQVAVVGGGPVGLMTALELASHGVASIVIEPRVEIDHSRPRAKTTSVRSMEHLRRLGLARAVRERAPIPVEWNQSAVVCTSLMGREITRFDGIFGLRDRRDELFAEPGQQIAQPLIEQILRDAASDAPLVTLLTGWNAERVVDHGDHVSVEVLDHQGVGRVIRAGYAVGADGARSTARKSIGIPMEGGQVMRPNLNLVFTAPELDELTELPTAVHYWIVNAETQGVLIRLDTKGTWAAGLTGLENPETADRQEVIARLVGTRIDAQVVSEDVWVARMLMADSYGTNRVFLVGDAAHLNPPWGGHGFNTGLGDAVNLGWKLAAVVNGWGGAALLDSYEAERRPIAQQTITDATANMKAIPDFVLAALARDPLLEGPEVHMISETVSNAKDSEFHSLGLVLGYGYGGSPVVVDDAVSATPHDPVHYTPSTRPGSRLPHYWLEDGRSIFDLVGRSGMTLLKARDDADESSFVEAARQRQIPFTVVSTASHSDRAAALSEPFILVRSDQHIAWRGDDTRMADAVLDFARGAGGQR